MSLGKTYIIASMWYNCESVTEGCRADIPLLAEHFLSKYTKSIGKPLKTLTAQAMAFLVSYDWPGNVRELQNMIERAVNLTPGRIIDTDNLHFDVDKKFILPKHEKNH